MFLSFFFLLPLLHITNYIFLYNTHRVHLLQQRKPNAGQEWLKKLPQMAKRLEESLYRSAPSFEAYNDVTTLKQRLQQLAINIGKKSKGGVQPQPPQPQPIAVAVGSGGQPLNPQQQGQQQQQNIIQPQPQLPQQQPNQQQQQQQPQYQPQQQQQPQQVMPHHPRQQPQQPQQQQLLRQVPLNAHSQQLQQQQPQQVQQQQQPAPRQIVNISDINPIMVGGQQSSQQQASQQQQQQTNNQNQPNNSGGDSGVVGVVLPQVAPNNFPPQSSIPNGTHLDNVSKINNGNLQKQQQQSVVQSVVPPSTTSSVPQPPTISAQTAQSTMANANPATGIMSRTSSDRQQVLRHQQQRLLLLRHAAKCPHEDGRCPVTPHCAGMKRLWKHIAECKDQKCVVPHCVSSRYVLSHYHRCKDTRCPVCGPVREAIHRSHEKQKQMQVLKGHHENAVKKNLINKNTNDIVKPAQPNPIVSSQQQQQQQQQQQPGNQISNHPMQPVQNVSSASVPTRNTAAAVLPPGSIPTQSGIEPNNKKKQRIQPSSSNNPPSSSFVPTIPLSIPSVQQQHQGNDTNMAVGGGIVAGGKNNIRHQQRIVAPVSHHPQPVNKDGYTYSSPPPTTAPPTTTKLPNGMSTSNLPPLTSSGTKPQEDHTLINCFTIAQIETHISSLNKGLQISSSTLKIKGCELLKILQGHSHGWVFNSPVNPVELGLPDYFEVIKRPMDLGTIKKRLDNNCYIQLDDFENDIHLCFDNAMLYNPEGSVVYNMASEMKIKFKVDFSVLIKQLKSEEDSKRKNGDACALCGSEKLLFEPPVFYCNGNNCPTKRINRNRYYFVGGNNQYHWCHPCYSDLNSTEKIQMVDLSMKKEQLIKKKNDEVHEESWVACDRCQRWIHQICGLFNTRQNKDQRSEYVCPRCTIEDRKKRGVTEGSSSTPMAEDLQRTTLSEALEMHVRIKVDRYFEDAAQEKAKTEASYFTENNNFLEKLFIFSVIRNVLLTLENHILSLSYLYS